jgi:peroxiredoxin
MNLMRKRKLIFLIALLAPILLFASKPKYDIKVKINGLKDTVCFLGNYYGEKPYIIDTAKVDSKGFCEFKGDKELEGGMYLIILPSKKYFDIIIDKEQFFSLENDTTNFTQNIKIKGSPENVQFYDYWKFIAKEQKEAEPWSKALKRNKDNKDSAKIIEAKLNAIDGEIKKYKLDFMKDHPETFFAKVLKTSYEADLPEAPLLPNGRKDSNYIYRYYKQHYFDYVDFSDDRLIRTPSVFHSKIKQYITSVILQQPDTVIKEADSLIAKARANKEVFKYVVMYITNWAETSNIMGFDAIFVHMVEKYYMTNQAFWITPANLEKIITRAKILKNLLLGTPIPNVTAEDTNGTFITLYNVPAKYTVLYFWDPTCGHCQKETPKLKALYDSIKTKGFEVYAFCSGNNVNEWKKYVKENKLSWINVMDVQNTTGYHTTYDIYSTPVIYLIDENKKILAKRLSADQLKEFMDRQFRIDGKVKK